MRIAQIPPLIESVPPNAYGGTERIVSYLTEGLVENGHDVTLFATEDSKTRAKLVPVCEQGLRIRKATADGLIYQMLQMEKFAELAFNFDVVHFHNDFFHFPVSRRSEYSHLTTLHGRLNIPALKILYKEFSEMPVVSISNNQRKPLPQARWLATVYHGLPMNLYSPSFSEGKYLAFLGRISVEKRCDRAIEIAKRAGIKLRIAAKVDEADKPYFENMKHLLDHPLIEFIGEINEEKKQDFLSNAAALLFPIDWPEPFGLVMIEAMACGTPVIAWSCGSVPEVIDEGSTGFIVNSVDDGAKAVENIGQLNRQVVRKKFEERFDAKIMVKNYERLYETVAGKKTQRRVLDFSRFRLRTKKVKHKEKRNGKL